MKKSDSLAKPADSMDDRSNTINKIGPGTIIEGNIKTTSDLRVDGTIVGNVYSTKKILMGENGKIEGKVQSSNFGVKGNFQGEMKITETLHLYSSGKIKGTIIAGNIVIEEGASFSGECFMNDPEKKELKG